ncbi:MAG: PAS domain S-box protein, partial [Candidatus Cloacimonetes bacterium]|nr:PAS domain S-box protein [Candidatus Cloacimonadota bacterium]
IIDINHNALLILELTHNCIGGRASEILPFWEKIYFNDSQNPKDSIFDYEIVQDSKQKVFEIKVSGFRDKINSNLGIIVILRDISNQQSIQKKLAESEMKYKLLIENQNEYIVKVNPNGNFIYASPSYCELFGRTTADLYGKSFMPLVHEDDRESTKESMKNLFQPPYTCYIEQRAKTKNGWRWLAWSDKAILDSNGKIESIIGVGRDITERKKSEGILNSIIDRNPLSIQLIDLNGFTIRVNRSHTKLFKAIPPADYSVFDDPLLIEQNLSESINRIKEGEVVQLPEFYYNPHRINPDFPDNPIWIKMLAFPILNEENSPELYVLMQENITEQKHLAESLKISQNRLELAMDAAGHAFWDWNLETDEFFFSPRYYTMLGYKPYEFESGYDSWLNLLHPEDKDKSVETVRNSIKNVLPFDLEFRLKCKDGNYKWINGNGKTYLVNSTGNAGRVVGVHVDIDSQKRAEIALSEERERLSVTLRSIGDGVITTDIYGRVEIINRAAEELTGWKQKEAVGLPLSRVFHIINGITREECEDPVKKVLHLGSMLELDIHTTLISRDNSEKIIADSAAPIKDINSNTIGVVLVFRDVTEKLKMQNNIQNSQRLESLGILAGGIAHDFNNLLSGIYGFTELAKIKSSDSEVLQYLEQSIASMDRARGLTNQLLTFSKGGAPVKKKMPFNPFLKENVKFALSGSNISPEFNIENDLWPGDFDNNQVSQVINNIVINAQQAMPMGGKIFVTARNLRIDEDNKLLDKGNYVKISITDSGIGMSPEILSHIFDPFFTTKSQGQGLGLASSYSIIKKHNGAIDVESTLGIGTTFHVYLPAALTIEEERKEQIVSLKKGSGRVLVMDDEKIVRETLSNMLILLGYTPVTADNGDVAVSLFREAYQSKNRFVAMICDMTIPGGKGGIETIAEIRKLDSNTPVFVASGYSSDPVMANPTKFGFTASMMKPFRVNDLFQLLDNYLFPEDK